MAEDGEIPPPPVESPGVPALRVQFESWIDVLARVHPHDILDVALGALMVLEARLPSGPDVSRAVGRALLAVDALMELAESGMTAKRSGRTRPTTTPGREEVPA